MKPINTLNLPELKLFKTGKVRSVYDFGDSLLLVATDRISAFDFVFNEGVPGKGEVLTQISKFWFDFLQTPHHLISTDPSQFPEITKPYHDTLAGRSMWVKKTELIEIECVARGYLAGSGWKEYQQTGTVAGHKLPQGLRQAERLPQPIFTPAIKASTGHDENISVAKMRDLVGTELTAQLEGLTLGLYGKARDYAQTKGILIADTKFEFGHCDGQVILIDEALTPDSSRFWDKSAYQIGISPPSFDKQILRDYLENSGWNKQEPIPTLPDEIIQKIAKEYRKIQGLLTQGLTA